MPLVSVIVPNYNHGRYLTQRIQSILNQSFRDFELILLDDASTDSSRQILESYIDNPKISHIIINSRNSGNTFTQIQKGLRLAKGDFIWVAESDDWAESDFLEKTVVRFTPEIGIVYTQSMIVDEHNTPLFLNTRYTDYLDKEKWKAGFTENGMKLINEYFIKRNIIPNMSAVLFRKEDLLGINNDSGLRYIGDWFIYGQILLLKNLCYISEPLNNYRQHSGSVRTKAMINGLREKEYYWLLTYFKGKNLFKPAIRRQFFVNTGSWIRKSTHISASMHLKIANSFLKYLIK